MTRSTSSRGATAAGSAAEAVGGERARTRRDRAPRHAARPARCPRRGRGRPGARCSARATAWPTVPTPSEPDAHLLHGRVYDSARRPSCGSGRGCSYKGAPGWAGTTICQKLGIKEGRRVLVLDPPVGFVRKLDPLPERRGRDHPDRQPGRRDRGLRFLARGARGALSKAKHVLAPRGFRGWPGHARAPDSSPISTSNWCARWGSPGGLTDDKIIAVDEIWSALRFVEKERDRLPLPRGSEIAGAARSVRLDFAGSAERHGGGAAARTAPVIDLTLSNPTRGAACPSAACAAASRRPCISPHPRGLPAAREAVAAFTGSRRSGWC